jgi:hypothetical protein
VCGFDLRTKTCLHRLQCFGSEHVVSVSLKPGKEEILYAAAGAQVYCLDLRLVCSESFSASVMASILLCLWLAILSMV